MENVLGLRSAAGGDYYTRIQKEARELGLRLGRPGYRVHGQIEDSWKLGAPQKRRRQLIVGVRADLPGYFLPRLKPARRGVRQITLGPAIADLPPLTPGEGNSEAPYDLELRREHIETYGPPARSYLRIVEVKRAKVLTNHVARTHSERDLRDFARLQEGETSHAAMRRGVEFEFPYDKSSFKDRYTRQSREKACSTIVAHLSKDGLMFIHPTQNRSLTPREAARVQGFPDWFVFPESRTHAFRLIGNAVPPLVAQAVGNAMRQFLNRYRSVGARATNDTQVALGRNQHAARTLRKIIELSPSNLQRIPKRQLRDAWRALLELCPKLHPDNALDHGDVQEPWPDARRVLPHLKANGHKRYKRSGWPVIFAPLGTEAWRRLSKGDLYVTKPSSSASLFEDRAP